MLKLRPDGFHLFLSHDDTHGALFLRQHPATTVGSCLINVWLHLRDCDKSVGSDTDYLICT